MKRLFIHIKKEFVLVKSNPIFHLAALASPLLFMLIFSGTLATDISFPITIKGSHTNFTHFALEKFKNPSGTPYLRLGDAQNGTSLKIDGPLHMQGTGLTGNVDLIIPSIDTNITKNYRNMIHGAINHFYAARVPEQAIDIVETTIFPEDPN